MKIPSSSEFLSLWERGQRMHPLDQGLLALQAAEVRSSYEELAALPLGQRNCELLALHAACFSEAVAGWTDCPECGQRLEFELNTGDLMSQHTGGSQPVVTAGGLAFRLPNSSDLAAAAREQDLRSAAVRLLDSCVLEPTHQAATWSDDQIAEVGNRMALADPLAKTRLDMTCSACGHSWVELLDVTMFLWIEVDGEVRRLLHDVHLLASHYGWSEAEILALSEWRRSLYREMVQA